MKLAITKSLMLEKLGLFQNETEFEPLGDAVKLGEINLSKITLTELKKKILGLAKESHQGYKYFVSNKNFGVLKVTTDREGIPSFMVKCTEREIDQFQGDGEEYTALYCFYFQEGSDE